MSKHKKYILLAIIVLSLIPILWYSPGYLITGSDINYPLYPQERFARRVFTWNSIFLGGVDRSMDLSTLFWTSLQAVPEILGLSLETGQILTFIFWFAMIGFSMFFLVRKIFPRSPVSQFMGTVFYMFNFYQFYNWEIIRIGEISGMVLLPVFLGLLIEGLNKRIILSRWMMKAIVVSMICMGVGIQPPILVIVFVTLISFWIYHSIIWYRPFAIKKIYPLILLIAVLVLTNMFWILPVGNYTIQSGYLSSQRALQVFTVSDYLLVWTSKMTSFLNLFRMLPRVIWFDSWGGEPYYPFFFQFKSNPLMIVSGLVISIMAFSSLLFLKTRKSEFRNSFNRYIFFFAILAIAAIFMSKGLHDPFGVWYAWMVNHIPGFWMYRAPWEKFGLIQTLGYAIMIGFTCDRIYLHLRRISCKHGLGRQVIPLFFLILSPLLIVVYAYPFVLGKMIPSSEGDVGYTAKYNVGLYQKFPKYIFDARNWVNSQNEKFNIALLPGASRRQVYTWGYAGATDITLSLFDKGIFFKQYGEGTAPSRPIDNIYNLFVESLYSNQTGGIANLLGLMNVRYILQRNDYRYDFYGDSDSPAFIQSRLSLEKGIELKRTIDKWDFYEIEDKYFLPRVYTTSNTILIDGSVDEIAPVVFSDSFKANLLAIFLTRQLNQTQNQFIRNNSLQFVPRSKVVQIPVYNALDISFSWSRLKEEGMIGLYCPGDRSIIRTDGEKVNTTLTFRSSKECPYEFPAFSKGNWTAHNSTIVYIKTGEKGLAVSKLLGNKEQEIKDIIGIWWETGWMGMNTRPVSFPLIIPSHQKAIVQIKNKIEGNITLVPWPSIEFDENRLKEASSRDVVIPSIIFQQYNPTRYRIRISDANRPFFLILSEPYDKQWKAYLEEKKEGETEEIIADYGLLRVKEAKHKMNFSLGDTGYLFQKPVSEENHFIGNGYANAWYIDPKEIDKDGDGEFAITLYFWPQSLFYLGLMISGMTFIGCISYLIYKWKRNKRKINSK